MRIAIAAKSLGSGGAVWPTVGTRVSVECAYALHDGRVGTVERSQDGFSVLLDGARLFGMGNPMQCVMPAYVHTFDAWSSADESFAHGDMVHVSCGYREHNDRTGAVMPHALGGFYVLLHGRDGAGCFEPRALKLVRKSAESSPSGDRPAPAEPRLLKGEDPDLTSGMRVRIVECTMDDPTHVGRIGKVVFRESLRATSPPQAAFVRIDDSDGMLCRPRLVRLVQPPENDDLAKQPGLRADFGDGIASDGNVIANESPYAACRWCGKARALHPWQDDGEGCESFEAEGVVARPVMSTAEVAAQPSTGELRVDLSRRESEEVAFFTVRTEVFKDFMHRLQYEELPFVALDSTDEDGVRRTVLLERRRIRLVRFDGSSQS